MKHGGYCYATMDKCPPESGYGGACASKCQSNYIVMPAGWTIAPDTADIRAKLVAGGAWGTHILVLEGGNGYWAQNTNSRSPGQRYTTGGLQISGNSYRTTGCHLKVVMRKLTEQIGKSLNMITHHDRTSIIAPTTTVSISTNLATTAHVWMILDVLSGQQTITFSRSCCRCQ